MKTIENRIVNTIRLLSADAVQKANSGHPGLPMGAAPMAFALWSKHLKGSATDPNWHDRDRFILSAGHGSMLHYALLNLFGYEVGLDDLKSFRQWESKTPGHPEYGMTPGVESTTGPLGQGLAMGVGLAIAESRLAAKFNREGMNIVDHHTFVIAGDGCLMEGITSEASSMAGHMKLGKLIVLYDDNQITIDGSTELSFTEDVTKRYEAYGWQVLEVEDGNDLERIHQAIESAKSNLETPTLIRIKTIIGFGSPNKAGTSGVHGSPLGEDELKLVKEAFEFNPNESFVVEEDVIEYMKLVIDHREMGRFKWEELYQNYQDTYPELAKEWELWHDYEIPENAFANKSLWEPFETKDATRSSGGKFMNLIKPIVPNLMGGSADLNGSTKTYLKGFGDYQWDNRDSDNLFFGVREHAMGAVLNGLALHGGVRPFGATFLVFSDYMKPAIRLSALMKLPVIYVFTHDSIGVGEDGPTHQPIEHLLMLRSIPNVTVFRPADPKETAISWVEALNNITGPSVIVLSRQNLPALEGVGRGAHHGGYVLSPSHKEIPEGILIGTGSEVHVLVEAQRLLKLDGIEVSVVSMPSVELFNRQNSAYREEVLPKDIKKRVVMEAGVSMGWHRIATDGGVVIGMDRFGESAPGEVLFKEFGFTAEHVVSAFKKL
ncbi:MULTISPECIES: transketolase [unclassified Fusibacter]|uniref:transketolase n=1 Tax=unclassified Fusibacter TaxID=2624464 RepID=UPI0010103B42|nr:MULTISPECIES: transketolase [unclassified Fusibacter]MCK8060535.1 transketolase [Fusibacter sp. A2]NPE23011.1 transketolase [Fusibacter sp. A1]RXV60076.1 transketolase [Fusibacter sp. A1]